MPTIINSIITELRRAVVTHSCRRVPISPARNTWLLSLPPVTARTASDPDG